MSTIRGGVKALIKQYVSDTFYPVGTIIQSFTLDTEAKVNTQYGGSWKKLGAGKVLWSVASGADYVTPLDAGLPSVSGWFETRSVGTTSGKFSKETRTTGSPPGTGSTSGTNYKVTFDLSKGGTDAIYGKSTTVQPPAYKCYMYRREL